jgi:hypothetical protein
VSDQQLADLAMLVSSVFPPLPCDAVSPSLGDAARIDGVSVLRREGDRFVVRWGDVAPEEGSDIELHLSRAEAVYVVSGRITGLAEGTARLVSVSESPIKAASGSPHFEPCSLASEKRSNCHTRSLRI